MGFENQVQFMPINDGELEMNLSVASSVMLLTQLSKQEKKQSFGTTNKGSKKNKAVSKVHHNKNFSLLG